MSTGDRIKKLRKLNNLTQEQLGVMVGVQKSAIAKYENNSVANLKRTTISKMAEIFSVSPLYIMCMEENEEDKLLSLYKLLAVEEKLRLFVYLEDLVMISKTKLSEKK